MKIKSISYSKFEDIYHLKKVETQHAIKTERQEEITLAELKKEFELIKNEISELSIAINIKEKSKRRLSKNLEISDWLTTTYADLISFIERNILLSLRGEFSAIFSKWFQMLVPEDSLDVKLDESFSPIIMYKETELEYSFLSGGERTAASLAYRLALNQIVNSILGKIKTKNIVILDEPTDGFSELQLDRMKNVLEELNVSQLIIVSHEQKIESFVDNILRIKKIEDTSNLDISSKSSINIEKPQTLNTSNLSI